MKISRHLEPLVVSLGAIALGMYVWFGAPDPNAEIDAPASHLIVPSLDPIAGAIVAGATNELTGSGFTAGSTIRVRLATCEGSVVQGPYRPTAWSPTTLTWDAPVSMLEGTGFLTLRVINTDQKRTVSESRGAPLVRDPGSITGSATLDITSVTAEDRIVTVMGTGFCEDVAVDLYAASVDGEQNFGGFDKDGDARIPLNIISRNEFSFEIPAGALPGIVYVRALNPPFISATSTAGDPDGALNLDPIVPALDPIDGAIVAGEEKELIGSGFTAGSRIKVFIATSEGIISRGPFTPSAWTPTSLTWDAPASLPPGTGFLSLQIVNIDRGYTESEARGAPLLAPPAPDEAPDITRVHIDGTTVTVFGAGFSDLTVINLFARSTRGVLNFGGLDGSGPRIPLTLASGNEFSFTVPEGALPGPAYVAALNPPFDSSIATDEDPDGAFALP